MRADRRFIVHPVRGSATPAREAEPIRTQLPTSGRDAVPSSRELSAAHSGLFAQVRQRPPERSRTFRAARCLSTCVETHRRSRRCTAYPDRATTAASYRGAAQDASPQGGSPYETMRDRGRRTLTDHSRRKDAGPKSGYRMLPACRGQLMEKAATGQAPGIGPLGAHLPGGRVAGPGGQRTLVGRRSAARLPGGGGLALPADPSSAIH